MFNYLLTPWCRVLLEKLTGLQLVKKFPAFHGTRRFITALTSIHHLSLSWASPIQSIYPHPTSWRSILILSTHLCLGLPSGSFPPASPACICLHVQNKCCPKTSPNPSLQCRCKYHRMKLEESNLAVKIIVSCITINCISLFMLYQILY